MRDVEFDGLAVVGGLDEDAGLDVFEVGLFADCYGLGF